MSFYKSGFGIKLSAKIDMPLDKETQNVIERESDSNVSYDWSLWQNSKELGMAIEGTGDLRKTV